MTKIQDIYKCNICGNIVEVLHSGQGDLVCCGEYMKLQEPQGSASEGEEKHVPVIEKTNDGYLVKIGSITHPMEKEHYIEWIEINIDGELCKKFLTPGEKPEFSIKTSGKNIKAREYCNVHGLWITS